MDTGYFFRRMQVELCAPAYRRHARFPIKIQHSIEAIVANVLENYLTVESLFPEGKRVQFDVRLDPVVSVDEAEKAAESYAS